MFVYADPKIFSTFFLVALAPSSTLAPAIIATPVNLQAAATLTEVANGIEAGVRLFFVVPHSPAIKPVNNIINYL